MQIDIKISTKTEARDAVADLDMPDRPDFLAAYFTEGFAANALADELASLSPRALHGGTSCQGVMSGAGMSCGATALGAFAITDPEGDYGTGFAKKGADPRASARQAIVAALSAAGRRGEVPDLVWLTGVPQDEEAVIAGLQDEVGPDALIVGGSAADNDVSGRWRVISAAGAHADAIVVSVLFPSRPISCAFHCGHSPTSHRALATATDGRRLVALDGRPAAEVYAEWTDAPALAARSGQPSLLVFDGSLAPLGRNVGHIADVPYYVLSHPLAAHPDGSLELFSTLEAGDEVVMMRGSTDSLTRRAGRVARQSLALSGEDAAPAGALLVYCAGCMMAVRERMDEVAADVATALSGAPFLGIFTFGEQGRIGDGSNRHGNMMISCISFSG